MLPQTLVQERPAQATPTRSKRAAARTGALLALLERAAWDDELLAQLASRSTTALHGYDLTWKEEAALFSGDVRWIEAHVGKLTERQRTWLDCRLQQEAW